MDAWWWKSAAEKVQATSHTPTNDRPPGFAELPRVRGVAKGSRSCQGFVELPRIRALSATPLALSATPQALSNDYFENRTLQIGAGLIDRGGPD